MERRTRRRVKRRSGRTKLLAYGFAAAAIFAAGVMVGGLLRQEGHAESAIIGIENHEGENDMVNRLNGDLSAKGVIDAPFIDQREKYPTGCESVAAVMALDYAGIGIGVEEFIDGYLPRGDEPQPDGSGGYFTCDPKEAFMGDPYTEDGWGCYAPVIRKAVERVLAERGAALRVEDLSGKSVGELVEGYIDVGVPVILWGTMYMEQPRVGAAMTVYGTGERFDWITPEHCLLLVGADGESYYFNDPLAGKAVAYGKDAVEEAYRGQGSQALAIVGR